MFRRSGIPICILRCAKLSDSVGRCEEHANSLSFQVPHSAARTTPAAAARLDPAATSLVPASIIVIPSHLTWLITISSRFLALCNPHQAEAIDNTAIMTSLPKEKEKDIRKTNENHWLDRYASDFHAWTSHTTIAGGQTVYQRPLGLVELSFDADGFHYGGRADMTATFTLALSHSLSPASFRDRIARAWTALRLRHVLLMARAIEDEASESRCFRIEVPADEEQAVRETHEGVVWIEDSYSADEVDVRKLHDHALNVGRVIEPDVCMSKLHVLPVRRLADGTLELSFLVIMAHQISDGLSAYSWFTDLIRLLNLPDAALGEEIRSALQPSVLSTRLPPAQETLYPRVKGSRARQRWIWAILRVLRHVQHTLPETFKNPLYRPRGPLEKPLPLSPTYNKLFAYEGASMPPLSTAHIAATLSPSASAKMQSLCRQAHLSIGAGCFALAGLAMMDLQASLHPTPPSSPSTSLPMTASFPLNPRSFFTPTPAADSCMLAFSDGIVMGSTPSHLPLEKRFRLAARTANRELKQYQKRGRLTSLNTQNKGEGAAALDKHAPMRLLATGYLASLERVADKLPPHLRGSLGFQGPQGSLAARSGPRATCGVSSVGSLAGYFRAGEYSLREVEEGRKDFCVDYRGLRMGVRAREGEFLVGSSTGADGRVGFGVSYDASAIDPGMAEVWAGRITGLLEEGGRARL